ncbi:hypothetical protein HII36_11510 [Nonomuraea sp. NN258]|uniref:hypothetical protein n=1 Tax=Nonomuraea antri TaxID=2730852 RepID=UPI0015697972|nr:hypothetical protein [Nonomuraea antri]NRQ32461.1 hypothetical protein [Nonomuraea antri]
MSTSADDGGEPGQDFARVWAILAHIVTPTTFVAAIMMYFGAVRANTMYGRLGVDPSLLGLTLQDYVLRSVTLTIEPLILILALALLAPPLHVRLVRAASRHRTAMKRVVTAMAVLGVACAAVGIASLAGWLRLPVYVMPFCLGLGVFVLVYCASLYQRLNPGRTISPTYRVAQRTGCVALLLILLLWAVTQTAQRRGIDAANRYRLNPGMMPSTVVYAARRLYLEGPGITETTLPDPDAMFRYRYAGLRLLIHSNQRYFLLPACWATNPWARAIALPAGEALRLEFSVLRLPPECPA